MPSCGGVAYAAQHGIPTLTYPASKKGLFPGLTPQELVQQLKHELGADYVLLAGYLKVRCAAGGDTCFSSSSGAAGRESSAAAAGPGSQHSRWQLSNVSVMS